MRIFLSAGEASGDAYATALVEELRKVGRELEFEGIGGGRMAAAIGNLVADSSTWGAMSISQSLKVVPRALRGYLRARKRLLSGSPGVLVAIDFGFFNIRLCRIAKSRGWKVLYLMPPSSWRRDRQGRDMPAITDAVVTPFPWSAELLKGIGANAVFFGHPIKQLIRMHPLPQKDTTSARIAVLPGSRAAELEANLPLIAEVVAARVPAKGLKRVTWKIAIPQVEFGVAPNLDLAELQAKWKDLAPDRNDIFTQGDVYGVLDRARAAIVCSGTATLEAALMRCPHVVIYRITPSMNRESKIIRFQRPKYIALPNIILDRDVVPELAGLEIDPDEVRSALEPLLEPGPEREAQLQAFQEIENTLGPDDAITRTAELIGEWVNGRCE